MSTPATLTFHRNPGREGNLDGQTYWTDDSDARRWEIESNGRGVWVAHRCDDAGYPLDTVVGYGRKQLETRITEAA